MKTQNLIINPKWVSSSWCQSSTRWRWQRNGSWWTLLGSSRTRDFGPCHETSGFPKGCKCCVSLWCKVKGWVERPSWIVGCGWWVWWEVLPSGFRFQPKNKTNHCQLRLMLEKLTRVNILEIYFLCFIYYLFFISIYSFYFHSLVPWEKWAKYLYFQWS